MSTRTLKRGAAVRAPVRKPPKQSLIDRLIEWSPLSHQALHTLIKWGVVGGVAAAGVAAASYAGIPGAVGTAMAEAVGDAGLRVDQIEITGLEHMDRMTVYAIALDQKSRAMPLVDLSSVRDRLLQYGWVADAHVSRRLPDTLLVQIVERKPTAVWQDRGQLRLISDNGVILSSVSPDAMPNLPLVIGPGAYAEEAGYRQLLTVAPALAPRVKAATWVGNRRWDLHFTSGETLALPAGDVPAVRALTSFAAYQASHPLLGKGWVRFDLRDPTRLVARRPEIVNTTPTPTTTPTAPATPSSPASPKATGSGDT